ncbi:equilibrative nucleoside transporter 3-like [Dreissena polymorpha]|uniref:Equilibrative nucleoside transporter 3 n=1 Tax=Dreissena polymorpha TaxID=45954 RepID=A0A9D4L5G1_DREPO|nr:equilibrative nucleoside transporter 3-like [Dreissena polymorpha]KAH3852350.1 hypothetical protein DPMN_094856 [Dreissena polymorpha]
MDTSSDPLLPETHGPIPKDRFHLVYMIFCLLGLGALIPWNFFITANAYFKYKLRNTTVSEQQYLEPQYETQLQTMFEGYLTVASTVPNLAFNFITAMLISRIGLKVRMVTALVLMITIFLVTVILVKMDTDTWQPTFFWITMVSCVLINIGSSILSTSLFGLASLFPGKYMQAVMSGQALGGVFAAISNLVTLSVGSGVILSGLSYFLIALFTIAVSLIGFASLYCIDYSRYHILEIGETFNVQVNGVNGEDSIDTVNTQKGCFQTKLILKRVWKEGLSVCIVFLVTLSCYPAISSSIMSLSTGNTEWLEKYFTALVCFLLMNCGDYAGRIISGYLKWPKFGQSNMLLILALLRVAFIPLLMYCNVQPRSDPVVFNSDIYPVVFILLLGLTNGHFGTLAMMYGPGKVMPDQAERTGAIMSSFLTTGLVIGSLLAILLMKAL